ncbi:MAG: FHA domain-containing protein [Myxococcales bacterium]|nr:FHA domain-containing protein [Myxococcales bacterium]
MGIEITVTAHSQSPTDYQYYFNKTVVTIGAAERADIQLPGKMLAPRQLEFVDRNDSWSVALLSGTIGDAMLNGEPLPLNATRLLKDGDQLTLYHYRMQVRFPEETRLETTPQNTSEMARLMASEVVEIFGALKEHPSFIVSKGPQKGLRYQFLPSMARAFIGRSPSCEFFINDANISREHAVVRRDGDRLLIEDLDSRNGLKINGQKTRQHLLEHSDVIGLGTTVLVFQQRPGPLPEPVVRRTAQPTLVPATTSDDAHQLLVPSSTEPVGPRTWRRSDIALLAVAAAFLLGALSVALYLAFG